MKTKVKKDLAEPIAVLVLASSWLPESNPAKLEVLTGTKFAKDMLLTRNRSDLCPTIG